MSKFLLSHINKVKLIFVSGPVGIGKTTFSRILLYSLSSKGYNVCYRTLVAFPLFSYMLFKLAAVLICGLKAVKIHEEVNIHPSTLLIMKARNIPKPIVFIFVFIEVLSIMLSFLIKVLFSSSNKKVIIVDEGIINVLASYLEIFGKNVFLNSLIITLTRKLQNRFNLKIIYLDVEDDRILLERWKARGYPAATLTVNVDHHLRYTRLIRYSKTLVSKFFQVIEIDNTTAPHRSIEKLVGDLFNVTIR